MNFFPFITIFILFFALTETKALEKNELNELCFFGGWPSIKKDNKCLRPWKKKVEAKIKSYNLPDDQSGECRKKYFRCNPLIFGAKCIKWNRRTDYNVACAESSPPYFRAIELLNDPSSLEQHNALLEELVTPKCRDESSYECDVISSYLIQVKEQIIQQTSNMCKIDSTGLIDIGNRNLNMLVNTTTKLETLSKPIFHPDEYDSLNKTEKKLFNNFVKLKGNPKAFFHALCFYKKHKEKMFEQNGGDLKIDPKNCHILINDYTKSSTQKRFYSLNICPPEKGGGEVLVMPSSHGGGKGNKTNDKGIARHFSDKPGTNLSPTGFLIIGQQYRGKAPWKPGIKLHGLQNAEEGVDKNRFMGNRNTYARGVVLHKSKNFKRDYCEGSISSSREQRPILNGEKCGRTHGCLGVPSTSWDFIDKHLKGKEEKNGLVTGPLLYTFGPKQANKPMNYCGGNNIRVKKEE